MAKSLNQRRDEELELLVSRDGKRRTGAVVSLSASVRWHFMLMFASLVGAGVCLWSMLYTSDTERLVHDWGMPRVANSMENILSLLALPALLFCIILFLYCLQQLYRAYKRSNDPSVYR